FDAHELRRKMHAGLVPNFNEMLSEYQQQYFTPLELTARKPKQKEKENEKDKKGKKDKRDKKDKKN
ncbi:MAG: hypothetical protein RSC36_07820, partial [Ruthenibacterium sp.]